MGVLLKKLDYLKETKRLIGDAIKNKDIQINDQNTFREYAEIINDDLLTMNISFGESPPEDTGKLWLNSQREKSIVMSYKGAAPDVYQAFDSLEGYPVSSMYAIVNDKVYFFCGYYSEGSYEDYYIDKRVCVFDTITKKVQILDAEIPYACNAAAVAAVGKCIYIFGGVYISSQSKYGITYSYRNKIQVFDTETNTFSVLSVVVPEYLQNMTPAVVGSKIYLFGGRYGSSDSGNCNSTIYVFSTESNTITKSSKTMSSRNDSCVTAVFGEKIYIFGAGNTYRALGNMWYNYRTDVIYLFDTAKNTYEELSTKFPAQILGGFGAFDDQNAYITNSSIDKIYRFNFSTEKIEAVDCSLLPGSYGQPLALVDDWLYILGRTYYEQKYTISMINTYTMEYLRSDSKIAEIRELDTVLPVKMHSFGATLCNGSIYLMGGRNEESCLDTIYVFSPEDKSVRLIETRLPVPMCDFAVSAVGQAIYIFGGSDGVNNLSTIYKFDTYTSTISALTTSLPAALSGVSATTVGDTIALVGGSTGGSYYRTIYIFDPLQESIIKTRYFDSGLCHVAAASIDSKICTFGGDQGSSVYSTTYIYDVGQDSLMTNPVHFPSANYDSCYGTEIAAAAVDRNIYLFGGRNTDTEFLDTVCVFNIDDTTLVTAHAYLPKKLKGLRAVSCGSKIYLFGGTDINSVCQDAIYVFDTNQLMVPGCLYIKTGDGSNRRTILRSNPVTIYADVSEMYIGTPCGIGKNIDFYECIGDSWKVVNS